MAVRTLGRERLAYRIGDPQGKFPIFSGEGVCLAEGRWHKRGQEVIYCSETYSTAMLEKLAHFNGALPRGQHFIAVRLPVGLSYEVVTKDSLENWTKVSATRAFGAAWLDEARSAVLSVPSYVARLERHVLLNLAHPEFGLIDPGLEEPVWWDDRLLRR